MDQILPAGPPQLSSFERGAMSAQSGCDPADPIARFSFAMLFAMSIMSMLLDHSISGFQHLVQHRYR